MYYELFGFGGRGRGAVGGTYFGHKWQQIGVNVTTLVALPSFPDELWRHVASLTE